MLHTAKWLAIGLCYVALCVPTIPFLSPLWAYIRITERPSRLAG